MTPSSLAPIAPLILLLCIVAGVHAQATVQATVTQAPSAEAAPLFNGNDLEGWTFNDDAQSAAWLVRDGLLHTTGDPKGYIRTERTFADGTLSLDIRHEVKCNTGILLRVTGDDRVWPRCIEAQGEKGSLGDIYLLSGFTATKDGEPKNKGRFPREGESNENAVGEWNHYDIVMNGGEITLHVNGEKKNQVTGADEATGWIAFQSEGGGVDFRNITWTPLADPEAPAGAASTAATARVADTQPADPAAEALTLFNGQDLTGWSGQEGLWRVKDGILIGETTRDQPTKGNTFLIYTGDGTLDHPATFDDFILTFEFRLSDLTKNNSGVQYRSQHAGNHVMRGYQFDIAHGPTDMGKLYDEKGRGRLAMPGEQVSYDTQKHVTGRVATDEELAAAQHDGWNTATIRAEGNRITHAVNGVTILDFTDDDEKNRDLTGLLGLQLHAGPPMRVEFRSLRLRASE